MVLPTDIMPQMLIAKLILPHAEDFDGHMYYCSLLLPDLLIMYPGVQII
jgi:hypothetical protein